MSVQSTSTWTAEERARLNGRLETIGWALFLIMIGGIGLVPKEQVPQGTWLIGVGLIMVGLNVARALYQLRMSTWTIILGVLALAAGLGALLGVALPAFELLLILIGADLLVKAVVDRER